MTRLLPSIHDLRKIHDFINQVLVSILVVLLFIRFPIQSVTILITGVVALFIISRVQIIWLKHQHISVSDRMKLKIPKKYVDTAVLALLITLTVANVKFNSNSQQELTTPSPSPTNLTTNSFPHLPLEVTYFNDEDVVTGTAEFYKTYSDIRQYSSMSLNNQSVYQSYPSKIISLKTYSNTILPIISKPLKATLENMNDPGWSNDQTNKMYRTYGAWVTHYLPDNVVEDVRSFDVDADGNLEMIVTLNNYNHADAGSAHDVIIKNNQQIFLVDADESSITPADTNNGFYVEWRIPDDTPRCCPEGYMRTRFVWKDNQFVPIYEQEVRYMKVGIE